MFKVGDRVECVDPGQWPLTKGRIYVVESENDVDYVDVTSDKGVIGSYLNERFRLVQSDGPVRTETVTRRRIVPGVYGRVRVDESANVGEVGLGLIRKDDTYAPFMAALTATELDDLALVASQLAEALRDA